MQKVTTRAIAKVAAVATGLAMATSMLSLAPLAHAAALTAAQVNSILALLSSFGADAATIANVNASLTGGTVTSGSTTTTTGTGTTAACTFTRSLTVGSSGADVTCLQRALMANGYAIPSIASGAAAPGYFGAQTRTAVAAWQRAKGIVPPAGFFGPVSRAAFNLAGSGTTTTTTGTTTTTTTTTTTGTGTTPTAGTGTGLKIALSATSPNGSVLVAGQGIGDLGDFVFANPTATPINVTALSFKRIGVSNDQTMTNVYLFNGATRITDSAGVSNSAYSFSDPVALFTVPAGQTVTVSVRSDIATGSSGQQIGTQLVSASSNSTLDSSVSFPINSGLQTISQANLATVQYGVTTSPVGSTSISPQSSYPVWQNTISVSVNPVKLSSLRFTNLGSIDSAFLTNLRLMVDGVQAGPAVASMGIGRTVTFDLSMNPVLLSTSSHTIRLLADITGGANRTILMSVQRSSDAMFVDSMLGQPVTPQTSTGGVFSAQNTGTITINSVSATSGISVSLDPASPNQAVAVGASSVEWARFDMLASGENVKVTDLFVSASSSLAGVIQGTGGLKNGKILVNGVQVGSTKDIGPGTTATDFALGSSLILPAGVTTMVSVYADAKDTNSRNFDNNTSVLVTLVATTGNAQGQASLNSANVPASNTPGNTITVSTSVLAATKYTGYGDQTFVAGTLNAKLGAFTLSTGSTDGVTVNTIAISLSAPNAASITNLTLKDDATGNILGTVITTPTGTGLTTPPAGGSNSNQFSVSLNIPISSSRVIDIYGNVLSGANNGPVRFTVDTGTSGVGNVTGISTSVVTAVPLQLITVGAGTLTVARGAGDPVSNNVLAGASSVLVGEFKFSANNTAFTVQNLAILVPNGAATSVTNVTVSYKDVTGATRTATQPLSVSATAPFATATFTGLTMYVPANDSSVVDVTVGTPTIASGGTSGAAINISLDAGSVNTTDFRAVNSAGATVATVNAGVDVTSNGTFYLRKSIPTFAVPTLQGGNIVPTNPLYRFSVTADPAGPIEWTKLTFNIATTTSTLTNVFIVDEATGVSIMDTGTFASTTLTTATVNLPTNNTVNAQFQQVAAGATRIYDLQGTVTGFTTGSSLVISLASGGGAIANGTATAVAALPSNTVWSDFSASPHVDPSPGVTSSADFTNGFLLKNFTTNSVSYSR